MCCNARSLGLIVTLGIILLGGMAGAQQATRREAEEQYSPQLRIHYRLVPYGRTFAASLTRNPTPDSPMAQPQIALERGDMITHLDNVPITNADELERHYSQTSVAFVNTRTRVLEARWSFLPSHAGDPVPSQPPRANDAVPTGLSSRPAVEKAASGREGLIVRDTTLKFLPLSKPLERAVGATNNLIGESGSPVTLDKGTEIKILDRASGVIGEFHELHSLLVQRRFGEAQIDRSGELFWYKIRTSNGKTGWTRDVELRAALRKIELTVGNKEVGFGITWSYPESDGKIYRSSIYLLTVSGQDDNGVRKTQDFDVFRFGVHRPTSASAPRSVGLADQQTHVIKAWVPTYSVHSAQSKEMGAWQVVGDFLIHDGPDDPKKELYATIGCIEICGGPQGFDKFNDFLIGLSGSKKSTRGEKLAEIGSSGKMVITYLKADRPPLKALTR